MKAEYKINIKPIAVDGAICEWSKQNIRLKVRVTVECENGRLRFFDGILCEETLKTRFGD